MKQFLIVNLLILGSLVSFSQNAPNPSGLNVQGLKIAYITRELNLSTDEAQKFWPAYFTYFDELKKAKSDAKDDVIAFDEKVLVVKKKYIAEFKKILLTDERANKVFLVDRNFGSIIRKEIQNRQKLKGNR